MNGQGRACGNGKEKTPVMVHRAPLGSLERFLAILIENYGGNFPTWLSPVQVKVLPITERHLNFANEVAKKLKEEEKYLTQNELAKRWKCAPSTVKSMRDRGELPFFQPPGSARILYPIDRIVLIENENTANIFMEDKKPNQCDEIKGKMPVNSSRCINEWRI